MQSSVSLRAEIKQLQAAIATDEAEIGGLRALKAAGELSEREQTRLRVLRADVAENQAEVVDLEHAFKVASDFEASEAGQVKRDEAAQAMRHIEAVGIALAHAGEIEDAAGRAYERAVQRRVGMHAKLREFVVQTVKGLDSPSVAIDRLYMSIGSLLNPGDSGIAIAVQLRRALSGSGAESYLDFKGVSVDSAARLSVEAALQNSMTRLLLTMGAAFDAAGFPPPARHEADTLQRAAKIIAVVDADAAGAA